MSSRGVLRKTPQPLSGKILSLKLCIHMCLLVALTHPDWNLWVQVVILYQILRNCRTRLMLLILKYCSVNAAFTTSTQFKEVDWLLKEQVITSLLNASFLNVHSYCAGLHICISWRHNLEILFFIFSAYFLHYFRTSLFFIWIPCFSRPCITPDFCHHMQLLILE